MVLSKHQFKTYYHGTRPEYADAITKEGLKTSQSHPGGSPKGVYFAGSLESASRFGDAVFAMDLPESQVAPVGMDGDWYMVSHNISPLVLKRVK